MHPYKTALQWLLCCYVCCYSRSFHKQLRKSNHSFVILFSSICIQCVAVCTRTNAAFYVHVYLVNLMPIHARVHVHLSVHVDTVVLDWLTADVLAGHWADARGRGRRRHNAAATGRTRPSVHGGGAGRTDARHTHRPTQKSNYMFSLLCLFSKWHYAWYQLENWTFCWIISTRM